MAGDYKFYASFIIEFIIFANYHKYIEEYGICLFKKKVLIPIKTVLRIQVIKLAVNNFIKWKVIYKKLATNLKAIKDFGNIYNNNNFFSYNNMKEGRNTFQPSVCKRQKRPRQLRWK